MLVETAADFSWHPFGKCLAGSLAKDMVAGLCMA